MKTGPHKNSRSKIRGVSYLQFFSVSDGRVRAFWVALHKKDGVWSRKRFSVGTKRSYSQARIMAIKFRKAFERSVLDAWEKEVEAPRKNR
jgi:hypothetical protein